MTAATVELPDGWQLWPQEAKTRLLARMRDAQADRSRRPFFLHCPLGDLCDGQPHPGVEWKHARPAQMPPSPDIDWSTWLILAGRGFGKTRPGSEWSWRMPRRYPSGAIVGPTAGDVRDIMVEGESGILACAPAAFRPTYEPSKRRLTYPNGATQTAYSADEPDRIRGGNHYYAWGDEWAAWRYMQQATDMLELAVRLGPARILYTTTPKPRQALRDALADPHTVVVRGSTYDNLANLAPSFRRKIVRKYEGTTLGQQELHAMLLDDVAGALWNGDLIAASRVAYDPMTILEKLSEVVTAVDPAVTHGPDSDETGIVVCARTTHNLCPLCGPIADGPHGLVLADLSGKYTPNGWAGRAVSAHQRYQGNAVVGEVNNGGDLVGHTVATLSPGTPFRNVRASRGKYARAEPVAALFEQGRVHLAPGLDQLEEQMRTWVPGGTSEDSPDRLDAMVWGLSQLMLEEEGGFASAA